MSAITELVRRELVKARVDECETWVDLVSSLAQEASTYKPDDVKISYICTGLPIESVLVKGSLALKCAQHEAITGSYQNPRVLVVRGIVEQSAIWLPCLVPKDDSILSDMETKLQSCNFDILFLEESTVEKLQGKYPVVGLKLSRLERLARCLNLPVNDLHEPFQVVQKEGISLQFHEAVVEDHNAANQLYNMVFISTVVGCTILLKGSTDKNLVKVKRVLKDVVKVVHCLETCEVYEITLSPGIAYSEEVNEANELIGSSFTKPILGDVFKTFREKCSLFEAGYLASLNSCTQENLEGGKSGCLIRKTADDKLIVKDIHQIENKSFQDFARRYIEHINANLSCLAKVYGLYEMHGKPVIVMENVFYGQTIFHQYDIKGVNNPARHGRGNELLDGDFISHMKTPPFLMDDESKKLLLEAVARDTAFLEAENVMDYSLLLGVNKESKQVVCAIIDFLRPFTTDKWLESAFKSFFLPKGVTPTVVEPTEYGKRLRGFVHSNFPTRLSCLQPSS